MKKYKDASRHNMDHDIEVGDLVISKVKTTKHDSIYDPKPGLGSVTVTLT